MKSSIKISGLKPLHRKLGKLPATVAVGVLQRAGMQALQPMAETAARLAPDDPTTSAPYDLKTSIAVGEELRGGPKWSVTMARPGLVEVYMGPTRFGYPQAIIQEFGSVKMAANPYMRPAFDQHWRGVFNFIAKAIRKELKTLAAGAEGD